MIKLISYLLSAALALSMVAVFSQGAEARHHGGIANGAAPTTPALTNTTVTLGQQTQAFVGYARLDSQDFTSPSYTPVTVSGLGLMSPTGPACDTWYVTYVSGRSSSDFLITSPVVNASAITPNVSGTGVGNLTGDYVYSYQCSRAGVFSNTATLTIHTIPNAANICGQDNFSSGWAPNNFGSIPGAKILLGTGCDFHNVYVKLYGVTLGSTNADRLTITIADAGRMPYISNFNTYGLSNIDVKGITATGNTDVGVQAAFIDIFGSSCNSCATINETWEDMHYYGSPLMMPSTATNKEQGAFDTACNVNCLVQNSSVDFVASGPGLTDNLHISGLDVTHFYDNCMGFSSLLNGGVLVDGFTTCSDPMLPVLQVHTDCIQALDKGTGYGITINNFWCIQAGATGYTQGPWFGGSQIGETGIEAAGYIDDGTGAHGPGTILTLTTGSLGSSSFWSQLWSPGNITIAQNMRVLASNTSTAIPTLNISATNIGSPGSPVPFFNVGVRDYQEEGIITTGNTYHGIDSVGESGTSFVKHFAVVQQDPNPSGSVSFTGSVNGALTGNSSGNPHSSYASGITITVTSALTTNSVSYFPIISTAALNYPGCPANPSNAFCDLSHTNTGASSGLSVGGETYSTEPVQATGTATFSCCVTVDGISRAQMTITGPCTGRWDYGISNGGQVTGLVISGTGVPDYLNIIPTQGLPADGCAGTYTLNSDNGGVSIPGTLSVSGRPGQGKGVYGLYNYGTGATPTGSLAMTTTQYVGIPDNSLLFQQEPRSCVTGLHQGTFTVAYGYASGGVNLCGAPVTNTTTTGIITPVAADFATGILPEVSLTAITGPTWDAMSTAQKRAATCKKMLPKVGGALDLGSGNFSGPFTATGEVQLAGGNVAVTGCGIH